MIELQNLCKTYKVAKRNAGFKQAVKSLFSREYELIHALNDVSFTIPDGQIVGYIGPNGAGKSSTIKVMSGILTPDSGSCLINGLTPWKDRKAHVRNIGVVFGQRSQLWWDVPVWDSFELLRDIYDIPQSVYKRNTEQMITLLNLSEILRTPARSLSLGQRMRCEVAAALLHDPQILFLDEPTIGLDAVSKLAMRDFIRSINKERNATVLLTTHDMQDIEALAERILLIGKGRILMDGTLADLHARRSPMQTLTIQYQNGVFPAVAGLSPLPETENAPEGRRAFVVDTRLLSISQAIARLSQSADITDLSVSGSTAEEMVVELYKEYQI